MQDNEAYISVEEAADLLRVSTRQAHRYGEQEHGGRLRTRKAGRRTLFHKGDVEALATELGVEYKPTERPKADIVPAGEMLHYIRERDQQLSDVQGQLNRAMLEVGRLQGQLEQRLLPEDADVLRQKAVAAEQERDALRHQLERMPWWARWLLRSRSTSQAWQRPQCLCRYRR